MATDTAPKTSKSTGSKSTAAGGGNILTKKMGPLPGWGWLVVFGVAYYLYKKYKAGSTTAATTAAPLATPTETLQTAGGTYTGPVGGAPGSVTNPGGGGGTPGDGGPTPGNGGTTPSGTAPTNNIGGATWNPDPATYAQTFGPLYSPPGLNAGLPAGYSNAASLGIPQTGGKTTSGAPG